MKVVVFKKQTQTISQWEGGVTHELLIMPATASYAKRNFKLRISKAYLKSPESDFTHLPKVNRNLLMLEGAVLLNRQKKKKYLLLLGDELNFKGEEAIHSKGTGIDFNVMWQGEGLVSSQLLQMEKEEWFMLDQNISQQMIFFHLHKGKVVLQLLGEKFVLTSGMSLMIDALKEDLHIEILAKQNASLVLSEILLK